MLGIDYRKDFFALKQEKKKNVKFLTNFKKNFKKHCLKLDVDCIF